MTKLSRAGVLSLLVSLSWIPPAEAQIATPCLKPVAIADKWEESETPPWDSSDTFSTADTYAGGFIQPDDQGRAVSLTLGTTSGAALPIRLGGGGTQAFQDNITSCPSTVPYSVGATFEIESGTLVGPMIQAFEQLIASDPSATWDPAANDGKGGVVDTAFTYSPRLVALPVYDPAAVAASLPGASQLTVVKIVGFFVSHVTSEGSQSAVHGYLTGMLDISMPPLTGNPGDLVSLYAFVFGPGFPHKDIPIEIEIDHTPIATVPTNENGLVLVEDVAIPDVLPGTYPGAVTARVAAGAGAGFFISELGTADLHVIGVRATTTAISTTSSNTSVYGQGVVVQVVVTGQDQVPGGTVEVFDSGVSVGTAPLTNGTAIIGPLLLQGGTHVLSATYQGDAFNQGSTSPALQHVVTKAASSIAFSRSPAQSVFGQSVTLTARVASIAGVPDGLVTFLDGGVALGMSSLVASPTDGSTATLVVSTLNAGTHSLSARYEGSTNFLGNASAAASHAVSQSATAVSLSSTPNPSKVGQLVTLRAVVTPVAPGGGTPTGVVEFLDGATRIGTATASGGIATLGVSSLKAGKHQLRARYLGTTNHAASMSAIVTQTVKGK